MKNQFTSPTVKNFRNDFQNAVLELEKKYGVTIKLGTLTYDETSVRGKMTAIKGDRSEMLKKEDFQIGERVKINHRKVLPHSIFEVVKINAKNIKVKGEKGLITVSPSLLVKL